MCYGLFDHPLWFYIAVTFFMAGWLLLGLLSAHTAARVAGAKERAEARAARVTNEMVEMAGKMRKLEQARVVHRNWTTRDDNPPEVFGLLDELRTALGL